MVQKTKLAIFFDQSIYSGGGYQQSINVINLIKKLPEDNFEIFFFKNKEENVKELNKLEINVEYFKTSFLLLLKTYLRRKIKDKYIYKIFTLFSKKSPLEKYLSQKNIDLVYFLSPTAWALDLETINYIYTVWDLSHRDDPEFPEVRENREFDNRENKFFNVLPKATAIIVDSELGKNNLIKRYCVNDNRVFVIPFEGNHYLKKDKKYLTKNKIIIKKKYSLSEPYIFYPAQFWAHKNHIYLIQGLKKLEEKYKIKLNVIFSGGDKGNKSYIKEVAKNLSLKERVKFAGFVDNDEMIALYLQSIALVMPSYFGPTNLPPLEAFELGVPVLYSDLPGLRDQVGKSALLMDLKNPESMADQLFKLLNQSDLRNYLIASGKERLKYFENFNRFEVIYNILNNFRYRNQCWK